MKQQECSDDGSYAKYREGESEKDPGMACCGLMPANGEQGQYGGDKQNNRDGGEDCQYKAHGEESVVSVDGVTESDDGGDRQ